MEPDYLGRSEAPVDAGTWKLLDTAMIEAAKSQLAGRRLVGIEGKHGEALGLSNDWAYRIIKLVGNYGEVFERNVGQGSPLKIVRGLNALWTKGGIQYAPPIR